MDMTTPIALILTNSDQAVADTLLDIINHKKLPIALSYYPLLTLGKKSVIDMLCRSNHVALLIDNNRIYLLGLQNGCLIKSHLNWQSLARRIVMAGRKNELLLQACKPALGMSVIDGTAGFGHDGLILASTGASVWLIEQNPVVALMLWYEYELMATDLNWHKLLSRITICYDSFLNPSLKHHKTDIVYLDPMFPNNSYAAKVGKNMQLLHTLALPPTAQDEQALLYKAILLGNKVVIKRPMSAPYLAKQSPTISIGNDAIRFDIYDNKGK